jgi:hypothetical protein
VSEAAAPCADCRSREDVSRAEQLVRDVVMGYARVAGVEAPDEVSVTYRSGGVTTLYVLMRGLGTPDQPLDVRALEGPEAAGVFSPPAPRPAS